MEAMKKQFAEKLQEMNTMMDSHFGQIAMRSAIREFFWENKFFMGQFMMAIDEMVDEEGEAYAKGEVDMLPEMQNFKQWGEHLVKHVNDSAVTYRNERWFKKWIDDLMPRVRRVWDALKADNSIQQDDVVIDDWVLEATSIDARYEMDNLPEMDQAFADFCSECNINPTDELKALWMAD